MKQLSLTHLVRQPLEPSTGRPPLLVLLHGVGSSEHDLFGLANELDRRFLIVSARAPYVLGPGSFGWYHTQFTAKGPVISPDEAESSRVLLLKFVEELILAYQVDPQRVYLMGFSQGCIMSLSASLTRPRLFAGVAGMSGRLLPQVIPQLAPVGELRGLPLIIVHGTDDQVLPIAYGRDIRDQLAKLPVDLDYREYPMPHTVSRESLDDVAGWLTRQLDSPDWRNE
jgi:phospholipase/carboxylesterase